MTRIRYSPNHVPACQLAKQGMNLFRNAIEVELLAAFHRFGVQYLVIGSHAVQFHGYQRPTDDLDLWVLSDDANAARFGQALLQLQVHLPSEFIARLAVPSLWVQLFGWHIEIHTHITGLQFEDAHSRAWVRYEQGVPFSILSLDDLIWNKTALGREVDLEDVHQLTSLPPPVEEITTTVTPSGAHTTLSVPKGFWPPVPQSAASPAIHVPDRQIPTNPDYRAHSQIDGTREPAFPPSSSGY